MKHLKTPEQNAYQNKDTYQLLKAIKELIKTTSLRKEGFEKLLELDADSLSVNNEIYYHYIKGKYYVLAFKASQVKHIQCLEYANDCYSDMVATAYQNGINLKSLNATSPERIVSIC